MQLKSWTETDDRSLDEMARIVGVHYVTFCRWVRGETVPNKEHARKIREMTNDKVTLNDFHRRRKKGKSNVSNNQCQ